MAVETCTCSPNFIKLLGGHAKDCPLREAAREPAIHGANDNHAPAGETPALVVPKHLAEMHNRLLPEDSPYRMIPAGETARERIAERLEEIANNFQIDPRQPLRELAAALRSDGRDA